MPTGLPGLLIAWLIGLALLASGIDQAAAQTKAARNASPRAEFASSDEAFIAARNAVLKPDAARFEQAAAQVDPAHPLRVYIDYWRLRLQLAEVRSGTPADSAATADAEAKAFVALNSGTIMGDLARRDWMLALGRREAWSGYDTIYQGWLLRDEAAPRCYALRARLARGEPVMAEARESIMQARDLGEACNGLLESLASSGQASATDLWQRLEMAIESGSTSAVRRAALLAVPSLESRQLEQVLARPAAGLEGSAPRELTFIGLGLMARNDPSGAADRMASAGARLRPAERAFCWSQIAAGGMRKLAPESAAWAREARAARPSDETLAWMTRAALRAGDWATVRSSIERMSESARNESTWTYWLARSIQAQSDSAEAKHQARTLFTSISGRPEFYSQLASEEIGARPTVPPKATPPTQAELAAARSNPGFERALRFYELGLRPEGNREWNFQLRGMNDRQLLAAAEYGRQRGLLDRMINTADRTRTEHDFTMRYPTPFVERLAPNAKAQGLDPAWVYGLIRQESRFIMDARSVVGASGLMQIMPATAQWIAQRMGVKNFSPSQINDLDTNLQFGTYYLKTVYDGLDRSPVMASAGYNAGPGRPRAWRGTLDRPVEGAIFAEIIPFTETRGYVKAVLSNAAWYSGLMNGEVPSLKTMLGEIQPGPATAATAAPGG
jgi:soluble lytic murein transglycosylase